MNVLHLEVQGEYNRCNIVLKFGRGVKTRQVVKTKCSLRAQDGACDVNGHHVKPEPFQSYNISHWGINAHCQSYVRPASRALVLTAEAQAL